MRKSPENVYETVNVTVSGGYKQKAIILDTYGTTLGITKLIYGYEFFIPGGSRTIVTTQELEDDAEYGYGVERVVEDDTWENRYTLTVYRDGNRVALNVDPYFA